MTVQPGWLTVLKGLKKGAGRCGARSKDAKDKPHATYRLLLATQTPEWSEQVSIELEYSDDRDGFSLKQVAAVADDAYGLVTYRTSRGGFVGVNRPSDPRGLRVELRTEGISLFVGSAPVGPGCVLGVAGTPLPPLVDFSGLTRCAEKLKRTVPSLAEHGDVAVHPEKSTDWGIVVQAMDALRRSSTGEPLFEHVEFGKK